MNDQNQVELKFPLDGYVAEETVRQLFHVGEVGDRAFQKAFRGCTMVLIEGNAFLPMSDLRDYLTYGRQTD